ncbi:hypothetical protein MUU75_13580 [Pseudoxanthomonas mexicana]|nr:hypothetical protein [Pseudoxanthomonas mexicana]UOV04163.1 hypothetical protein MUU75_13580 [Pseudoxanthomonas mexicana]
MAVAPRRARAAARIAPDLHGCVVDDGGNAVQRLGIGRAVGEAQAQRGLQVFHGALDLGRAPRERMPAPFAQAQQQRIEVLAPRLQLHASLGSDAVLAAPTVLGERLGQAHVLQPGQGGVHRAGAGTVIATGKVGDRPDHFIAVAGLGVQNMQDQQLQLSLVEHAATTAAGGALAFRAGMAVAGMAVASATAMGRGQRRHGDSIGLFRHTQDIS